MNLYLLFKSLHLIAVISWMAGLLYLPRIFVYHAETRENKEQSETFKLMEKRLLYIHEKKFRELIWILEHNHIYTAGTSYKENEILDKSIKCQCYANTDFIITRSL